MSVRIRLASATGQRRWRANFWPILTENWLANITDWKLTHQRRRPATLASRNLVGFQSKIDRYPAGLQSNYDRKWLESRCQRPCHWQPWFQLFLIGFQPKFDRDTVDVNPLEFTDSFDSSSISISAHIYCLKHKIYRLWINMSIRSTLDSNRLKHTNHILIDQKLV